MASRFNGPLLALAFSLAQLSAASPAVAMQNYMTDDCTTQSRAGQTLEIKNSSGDVSPHRLIVPGAEAEDLWVNLDQSRDSVDVTTREAALVLRISADVRGPKRKVGDGCFEGEGYNSVRTARVLAVNRRVSQLSGLKAGETLRLSCYQDYRAPKGAQCD